MNVSSTKLNCFPAAAAAVVAVTSGPSSVVRRQKRSAPKEEKDESGDEEEWSLKDVIFVEDSPNFPMIGRVLKVKVRSHLIKTDKVTYTEDEQVGECKEIG